MNVKSGRKKGTTQKILDLLPQDLVKSIVIKILERAEGVRTSLNSDVEPKTKIARKTKKAFKSIEKKGKNAMVKANSVKANSVKAKAKVAKSAKSIKATKKKK